MFTSTKARTAAARSVAVQPLFVALAAAAVLAAGVMGALGSPGGRTLVPSVHLSAPDPVMAGTATTSTTQLYKFSSYVAGKPVRWNPCATIHWRFRPAYAPTGGWVVVRDAVAHISQITGIHFVYDGTTTAVPTTSWLPTSTTNVRPLLIGWTDGSHSDLLRGLPSSVLGVTRTAYFGGTVNGTTVAATKAAVIALDRTDQLPMTGSVSWTDVVQHELGHAMGLDHVGNVRELMYPMLQRALTGLQSGDVSGLQHLGRAAGCIALPF